MFLVVKNVTKIVVIRCSLPIFLSDKNSCRIVEFTVAECLFELLMDIRQRSRFRVVFNTSLLYRQVKSDVMVHFDVVVLLPDLEIRHVA